MYTLDLRSIDDSINNKGSNEEETFSVCREIVGYYYSILNQAGYFINENNNEHYKVDYKYETKVDNKYETIDEIVKIWTPIFTEMVQNDEYDTIISDYKNLIWWPLIRLRNISNVNNNKNHKMKNTYCNLLFRRTSEYISYAIETKSNMWNFINILIKKMMNSNLINSDLKKLIDQYSVSRCVAVSKIIHRNHSQEWKISFSGFWDNKVICKKFGASSCEDEFSNVYSNVITRIRFKNISPKNMTWCKLNYNEISYEIKPINKSLPYKLSCFKKHTHRVKCCKRHFSCCERKILADTNNFYKIRRIKFYVTYEPCIDCQKAIDNINSCHKSNFISVVSKKKYTSKGHICGI
ncbi:hypothetical protein [Clostridium botulinum]|nr:hypothetical protein [Clostridium botulinum]